MSISIQNEANVVMAPAQLSSGGTAQMWFDRIGFDYAEVDVVCGVLSTSGGFPSVCRITESDATVISNFTTITGGSATMNASIGESVTKFQIDLRNRKRYINLDVTNGTTTLVVGAVARLIRAEQSKDTAAAQSVTNKASTATTAVSQIVRF